jgi:hypothetical protein
MLEDGRIEVTAADFPFFLYQFTDDYDPKDPDIGLCRGHVLVRVCRCGSFTVGTVIISQQVWKHIFMGPGSALKQTPTRSSTKQGQAGLNRLERVTPRTIAYAAMHVCTRTYA